MCFISSSLEAHNTDFNHLDKVVYERFLIKALFLLFKLIIYEVILCYNVNNVKSCFLITFHPMILASMASSRMGSQIMIRRNIYIHFLNEKFILLLTWGHE